MPKIERKNLKAMSARDQKNITRKAISRSFTTSKIITLRNHLDVVKISKKDRVVFHMCNSEDINEKYPKKNICIHNFGNFKSPGVTFPNNGMTQEEELLRKYPELFYSLRHSNYYPMDFARGCVIVTDYVERYRSDTYQAIQKNKRISNMFVTAPAPDHMENCFDEYDTLQYVRNIIMAPIIFANRNNIQRPNILVLGGWGCGVFKSSDGFFKKYIRPGLTDHFNDCKNYIEVMAKIFKHVLVIEEMYKYYEKIIVAIPCPDVLEGFVNIFK
jgi:uncharacterized protein (TIGR02452 family)